MSPDELPRLQAEAMPKLIRVLTASIVLNVLLGALLIGAVTWAMMKKPLIIATTESGRIIPIVPLDQPYTSDARVVSFADECIRAALSHDFVNFRASMQAASECFTTGGSDSFYKAMDPLLADLQQRRMVMSVTPTRPPVIVKPFMRAGVRSWQLQSVVTINREGTKERITPATYIVSMVVERVPLEESVRGISVAQIDLKPGTADTKF